MYQSLADTSELAMLLIVPPPQSRIQGTHSLAYNLPLHRYRTGCFRLTAQDIVWQGSIFPFNAHYTQHHPPMLMYKPHPTHVAGCNVPSTAAKALGERSHHDINVGRIDAPELHHSATRLPHGTNAVGFIYVEVCLTEVAKTEKGEME